jgi:hypothetical protein
MILEDQLKQANAELNEKKEGLKKVRPPTATQKKDEHKIKLLENTLEKGSVKFNDTVAKNKAFRDEIDVMRKEMRNALKVQGSLKKDIKDAKDNAIKMNGST